MRHLLKFEAVDRRRILIVALATAVSLPFLLSHARSSTPTAIASADGTDIAGNLRTSGPSTTAVSSLPDIGFLNGPATTLEPAPILIGVPPAKPTNEIDAKVGFRVVPPLWRSLPRPCIANTVVPGSQIPVGTTLTVMNLNNSHVTTCVVVTHLPLPSDQMLQLTESLFAELGDQIDAPLSVRVSWK